MVQRPKEPRENKTRIEVMRLISNELDNIASQTLMTFAEKIPQEELYRLLIPTDIYETMYKASLEMPIIASPWIVDNIMLDTFTTRESEEQLIEYSITYISSRPSIFLRPRWLWPARLTLVLPDNYLGRKLLPLVDLAIQWQTTKKLFYMITRDVNSLSLIMHMCPWIRSVIPMINTTYITIQQKDFLRKLLDVGSPRYVPGVSKWFGSVCNYGTELVSLYSMIKRDKVTSKEEDNEKAIMIPILNDNLIEDGLLDHFNDFLNNIEPPRPIKLLE